MALKYLPASDKKILKHLENYGHNWKYVSKEFSANCFFTEDLSPAKRRQHLTSSVKILLIVHSELQKEKNISEFVCLSGINAYSS